MARLSGAQPTEVKVKVKVKVKTSTPPTKSQRMLTTRVRNPLSGIEMTSEMR